MNAPLTAEGWQAWDMAGRIGGQLRIAGMGAVVGIDMTAALSMAEALGYGKAAMVELLSVVEGAMVRALNRKADGDG